MWTLELTTKGISFYDTATGVTRSVLLGSLLFPTVSTKTVQMAVKQQQQPIYKPKTVVELMPTSKKNRLAITVNQIMVINMKFEATTAERFLLIIDLPPYAKIPVSRDDVYLSSVKDIFIENVTTLASKLVNGWNTIVPLEYGMDALKNQTLSEENHIIMDKAMSKARWSVAKTVYFIGVEYVCRMVT